MVMEMFERFRDEGFGAVESVFAVMSWMDDVIEDVVVCVDEDVVMLMLMLKEWVEDVLKVLKLKTASDGVVGAFFDALR